VTPLPTQKSDLRQRLRRALAAIPADNWKEASDVASARLLNFISTANARAILFFMPTPTELDISYAARQCLDQGRTVCLPRADWDQSHITPCKVTTWGEDLIEVRHGIREPGPDAPSLDIALLDLIVVPGLAFDPRGGRLGKGGGFYDRFLASPGLRASKVGIALDAQVIDSVPMGEHDVPLDAVVTPTRVLLARAGP